MDKHPNTIGQYPETIRAIRQWQDLAKRLSARTGAINLAPFEQAAWDMIRHELYRAHKHKLPICIELTRLLDEFEISVLKAERAARLINDQPAWQVTRH